MDARKLFLWCFKIQQNNQLNLQPIKQLNTSLLASLLLVFVSSGCTQSNLEASNTQSTHSTSATSSTIRIGYQKGGLIPIARQLGKLDRELATQNIKVEWNGPFDRCASLLQAIVADQADIGGCGDIPSISGFAGGQSLCIGAIQPPRVDSLGEAILVREDSDIRKPADLIGKKVAVNQGGAGEYLLLKVLEREKIPADQVQRVYLGPSDAGPALYQGAVDAWAVWEPYVSIAQLEHGARRITTTHPAPTYGIMVVREETATQYPEAVKAALMGLDKDAQYLNEHSTERADYLVKELKVSRAVAEQSVKNRGPEAVAFPSQADLAKLQETADWLLEQKVISRPVDIAAKVCPLGVTP